MTTTGILPKGYLNDPVKTAQAWPTIDGVRYSMPGDLATVEADGTVTLLGRGSEVVNTGGEKVFVEEVETSILTYASPTQVKSLRKKGSDNAYKLSRALYEPIFN